MTSKRTRRLVGSVMTAALLSTLIALGGCHRKADETAAPPAEKKTPPDAAPAEGPKAWQGHLMEGSDTESLKGYLRNAPEVAAKKAVIEPDPNTIAFDRQATIEAIRLVSRDGSVVVLDADQPKVREISVGRIIWMWNLMVRKVEGVSRSGDQVVLLTSPALITEAFRTIQLEFDAPIRMAAGFPAISPRATTPPQPTALRANPDGGLMPVMWYAPDQGADPAPTEAPPSEPRWDGMQFSGSARGFDFTVAFAENGTGLRIGLEARYGADGGGIPDASKSADTGGAGKKMVGDATAGASPNYLDKDLKDLTVKRAQLENEKPPNYEQLAKELDEDIAKTLEEIDAKRKSAASRAGKKLWDIVSDNIDVRLRAVGEINDFDAAASIAVSNGTLATQSLATKGLQGKGLVSFVGRLGKTGVQNVKVPVMELPFTWNVPVPVLGIPFIFQLGVDFSLTVSLSGQHATLHLEGEYQTGGSAGYNYGMENSSVDQNLSVGPHVSDYQANSPGVSAAVIGVQLPRLGLGLGVIGASAVSYVDAVHVFTVFNSASAAIGLAGIPCKHITYDIVTHLGIDTQVLPFLLGDSFIGKAVNEKLSKKMVLTQKKYTIIDPPVKACEVAGS